MKKTAISLALATMLGVPAVSQAGYHVNGYVNTTTNSMYGSMNVRYNTADTTSYLYVNGYAGSTITFYGRNSSGTSFYCYVPSSSSLYSDAVAIRNSVTSGSYLYIYASGGTGTNCTSLYTLKSSYFLD